MITIVPPGKYQRITKLCHIVQHERFLRLGYGAALVVLTCLGFWLRVRHLGQVGFAGDEETTALAVTGLLDQGYPVMPSGMLYFRGVLFSYAAALSAALFGLNEFALRLPAVLFGVARIPLIYALGRSLFDRRVALLSAVLLTFAVWDIEVSRTARMYSMFGGFYLLSLYVFYRGYFLGHKAARIVAPCIIALTVLVHELGATLVLLFLVPLLVREYRMTRPIHLVVLFMLVTCVVVALFQFVNSGYVAMRQNQPVVQESSVSFLSGFTSAYTIPFFSHLTLFTHVIQFHQYAFFWAVSAYTAFTGWLFIRLRSCRNDALTGGLFLALWTATMLHQMGVAVLVLLAYLYLRGKGFRVPMEKPVVAAVVMLAVAGIAWMVYGVMVWHGYGFAELSSLALLHKVIKALVGYPTVPFVNLLTPFPKTLVVLAFGAWLCFHRAASEGRDAVAVFLLVSLVIPLLGIGVMSESSPAPRYLFHLYVLSFLLYVATLDKVANRVVAYVMTACFRFPIRLVDDRQRVLSVAALIAGLLVLTEQTSVGAALSVGQRQYGDPASIFYGYPFVVDHKTAGQFLRSQLTSQDKVIAVDMLQQYYYAGKVDYWLRKWEDAQKYSHIKNGIYHDIYTNAKLIQNYEELQTVIKKESPNRVWLVTSGEVEELRDHYLPKEIYSFLKEMENHIVFRGGDNYTAVYLFNNQKN
jgi:uncharacterized membrane protein